MELHFVLLTGAIILSFVFLCLVGRQVGRFLYLTSKIPGPSLWHLATVHAKHLLSDDLLVYARQLCESYDYKPWGTWMCSGNYVTFVSNSETAQVVFKSKGTSEKPKFLYSDVAHYTGNGLLTMNGQPYKRHRKIIGYALRKSSQKPFVPRLEQCMSELIKDLSEKASEGGSVDLRPIIEFYMIKSTLRSVTSRPYAEAIPLFKSLVECVTVVLEMVQEKAFNPLYFGLVKGTKPSTKETITRMKDVIADIDSMVLAGERTRAMNEDEDDEGTFDILQLICKSYLKQSEQSESESEIFDQIRTVFIASYETTAFTVNIVLLVLALNQEAQQRVFEEVKSVLGESDRTVDVEDLQKMEYLDRAIKESMRLFPPGGMLARKVTEETDLNGVVVPKGSLIVVHAMAIHRSPENFKDPLKFDPDRFLPENCKNRHPCSFIPFSFGSRNCPGQLHAFLTMKLFMCHIVRNFKILPGDKLKCLDDIKVRMCFTTHLCDSSLRLVPRNSGDN